MRTISTLITAGLVAILVMVLIWLGYRPAAAPVAAATRPAEVPGPVLRLGLIPERDVFAQRRAYQQLADYVSAKSGTRIELATVNSYRSVLDDLHEKQIDAAFLGSLVAVLAVDREGAQISCKPEYEGGISTYRGVVFVRADSPIQRIEDLAGHSLGVVRTTTGGNLFPMWQLVQRGMLDGPRAPRLVWIGTHDDVISDVAAGQVEAGAAKDLRLDAYEKQHPDTKFRRLASSDPVPENALVWRRDVPESQRQTVIAVLQQMDKDAAGKQVLAALKMNRFVHCHIAEYRPIYQMIEQIGPAWSQLGINGPPPKQPMPAIAHERK
jgi:phosphonate transport system substrate-binding protein